MKILKFPIAILLSAIMAFPGAAQIPGTTRVTAPIAPPATNSSFGSTDALYVQGGFNTGFLNVGDWNNTSILPDGRCHINMRVSAKNDTNHQVFRLVSLSPRTWELDVDATRAAATNGVLTNPTASGLILSDGTANKLMKFDGLKKPTAFTGTSNRYIYLDNNGNPATGGASNIELDYNAGLNQNVQTALTALQNTRANIGWVTGDVGDIMLAGSSNTLVSAGMNMTELTNMVAQMISDLTGVGASTNMIYLPTTYYDLPDGSVNTVTNAAGRTKLFQDYVDLASSKYTNGIRATLMVPPGKMTGNQITLKPNMVYRALGEFVYAFAANASGNNKSIWRTVRATGANVEQTNGVINRWSSWVSGYDNPDAWYGLNDNMTFAGPGRFILDANDKIMGDPLLFLTEVRNFVVEAGAIEVRHSPGYGHWGIRLSGRNIIWVNPIVKNGSATGQDGLHITNGKNILVIGGDLTSGDDSIALGGENNGGSNISPDEDLSDVAIVGARCDSVRARAIIAYSGFNRMRVPYTKGLTVRRVTAIGLVGHVAKERQSAFWLGFFPDRDAIFEYTFTAGSGMTDGLYTRPVTGGGGSGAECVFRVSGGQIVGAWPRYDSGATWYEGSGYTGNGSVDTSGLGGTPGTITAVQTIAPNDKVEEIYFQGKHTIGSATSETTTQAQATLYGLKLEGCRRVKIDLTVETIQNSSTPVHRPIGITSAEDCTITYNQINGVQKSSGINSSAYPNGRKINNIRFVDCHFVGCTESGASPIKMLGTNGIIAVLNSDCRGLNNGQYMIRCVDLESGIQTLTENLIVSGCSTTQSSGSPSNSGVIGFTNSDGVNPSVGRLIMNNNVGGSFVGAWPTVALFQSEVSKWNLSGNVNLPTVVHKTATIASGSTTLTVTVGTGTGLTSTSSDGIANLTLTPTTSWGSATKYWVTPVSATSYQINVDAAPGSSLVFAIREDTGNKN